MRFETLAVHAGHHVDPATAAVTPPIHLTTTFERDPDGSFPSGHIYGRDTNPNRNQLEECLTLLEGGAACVSFASGSAATLAVFQSLRPGDRVLVADDAYYGTIRILREILAPWGLQYDAVNMCDTTAVRDALAQPAALLWLETPSNPLLRVTDIAAVVELAHAAGARVAVDNTWCTAMLQRPLELGADYVMHSTTKYLGGHSDLIGGAVIAREPDAFFERMQLFQKQGGAVPSPFDCWLLMRGIRTLPYRMRAHCENAARVAEFLESNAAVEAVHYPGLPSHAAHAVAKKQMVMFGGMLSFQVHGARAEALKLTGNVKLFTRATSLGGPESLIEHRASVEGPHTRAPENLLRVSVGLEHPDDLIEDLGQALARV
ncbi:MAG TPA: aminotransferase class I/II-fold pyridoxal phosphate-dependent enzyme [Longimicrobiales bacterium]